MVLMKVMSYNVRGLGGGEKRVEMRRLVQEKISMVLCIQESKLSVVSNGLIKMVWGDALCGYLFQPSAGASGGPITVWDVSRVDVSSSMSFGHVLVIKGKVISTSEEFVIVNVYAPCDLDAKKVLWERMSSLVLDNMNLCLCVCGDFNSVRNVEERKGRGEFSDN